MNRIVIIGRLGSDPELRHTTSGKSVASFRIAVQKRVKPQDGSSDSDWFSVQCWDKTAEFVANYVTKGRLVAVDGRLSTRKYTASDGTNREVVEIVADNVQRLERARDDEPGKAVTKPRPAPLDHDGNPTEGEFDPFADE